MSGVFTSVFVLTFSCHGQLCGTLEHARQRAELPTQQSCTFLREAVISRSTPNALIRAECVGEVREAPALGPLMRADP